MATSIPRFLLPQRSSIWAPRLSPPSVILRSIRNGSTQSPRIIAAKEAAKNSAAKATVNKTPVLEKPSKFSPPSHPQRLNQTPRQYPGPRLSAEERAAQATKSYPNMMPRPGTVMHSFLNNRGIHLFISLGVLFSVAGWSIFLSYKNSPFGDMLPPISDVFYHPFSFFGTVVEVIKLEAARKSEETKERRQRRVDDIGKRAAYRKAHGLETEGFGGWTARTDEQSLGPALDLQDPKASVVPQTTVVKAPGAVRAEISEEGMKQELPGRMQNPRRWLGIW